MLSRVDLPQPEWPISDTNSPRSMVRSMSRRTSVAICATAEGHADLLELEIAVLGHDRSPTAPRRRARRSADDRDQLVEQEADDADVGQGDDDVADARAVPRVPDEEADADAADQHLGGDDGEPAQAHADAQAGEDVGHAGRQGDLVEHLPPRQPDHRRRRCGSPAGCSARPPRC